MPVPGNVSLGFPLAHPLTATSASDAWIFPDHTALIGDSYFEYNSALHWNGTAWRASSFPGKLTVQAAAALRPDDMWAFGVNQSSADTTVPFTARYDGRAWHRVRLPVAPLAVAAAGHDDLWVIGPTVATAARAASRQHIIAMRWNGWPWSQLAVPKIAVPAGQSFFSSASMVTAGSRDIWWYYQASSQDNRTSRSGLLHWNGAAWQAIPLSAAAWPGFPGQPPFGPTGKRMPTWALTRSESSQNTVPERPADS